MTPSSEVWRRDNVVLYRYHGEERAGMVPIVLVMSLVTKPYVFDLRPGSSLVQDLLDAGHDVFLLDWGIPEPVDAHNGIDRYTDHYLPRAVEAAACVAQSADVTLFGYCMGALLALLSTAGNPQMPVRNIVALATPVKLRDLSPMTTMLAEGRLRPDDLVDETGNVPASLVMESLRIVKPTAPLATYSNLWQSLADDEALSAHNALVGWSNDHIPFPGTAFRQLATDYIAGGAPLGGTAPVGDRIVSLGDVRCPVLSVVGAKDHLVPPEASAPLAELLSNADLTTLVLPAGHAGLFIGRQARTKCVPSIIEWLAGLT
ncbi:alpha/beta fold hydrolase [Trujillonella endophytica]|uniref:alpha/beta fold hydrolase n=1 Tax=Trujillonella endophytica TaxID=673521 RepID=UPI001B8D6572|nr:alpha/beta fold hydrolase [Trujillella endophytica]